ncbi:FMN reductase [Streptomyces gibsoniae]|uniref:FMN reductase n=1 Tax=Streptomyces gibsoniae TaxID=3075529 RepID=A0ABU2TYH7_9ACTN|nr:FMN reductase [Streptomyces sp. DSM 41699]MDT0466023.1 FMN reductase [Streptomyces sp. DSM 41699]
MKLVVVSAGLSVPSSTRLLAERLAAAVERQAPVEVRMIELRDLAVEIAHNFTNGFPGRALAAALEAVTEADGLIVVTPVFSASYSGLFKSFFDVLDKDALVGKPVLVAATGGTARHSLVLDHALRPLFSYLRAMVAPTGVYAASEDWGAEGLPERIERAAGELALLMTAGAPRERGGPVAESAGSGTDLAGAVPEPARPAAVAVRPVPEAGGSVPRAAGPGRAGGVESPPAADAAGFRVIPFEEQLAALRS